MLLIVQPFCIISFIINFAIFFVISDLKRYLKVTATLKRRQLNLNKIHRQIETKIETDQVKQ